MYETRVLSGMRPTGALHLGHYHGVLKNWVRLQAEYPCLFFVADWHALTTDYEKPADLQQTGLDMVIDWLAAGVDPNQATLFVQSQVLEHAELHLLLSMITPLGWLERVPTYKDQQEKLADKDLSTYGFLGYPLLQAADILIYRARYVPVGEDQVPHVEFTREVARRFNHLYGREPGFEDKAKTAVKKMGTQKGAPAERVAHQVPGKRRRRGAGARPGAARRAAEPVARRPRAPVRLAGRRRPQDPGRARSAADRGLAHARPRWPEDVQVLRQHHRAARGARIGGEEDQDHADRPGAGEAHRPRAIPRNARSGTCTRSTPMPNARSGW